MLKSARSPLLSSCTRCKTQSSFLTTICTECRTTKPGDLTLNPYVDWREAVLKQRELDEADAQAAAKKKNNDSSSPLDSPTSSPSDSPSSSPSPSPSPLPTYAEPSSPNKRRKLATGASMPVGSPSSTAAAAPLVRTKSSGALDAIPVPNAQWILDAREALTIRAIEWLRTCMAKAKREEFAFHGGDIIFLLRNAIFKGRGEVAVR